MRRFDAVIFDLDGTLLDTSPGIRRCADEVAATLGFPVCRDDKLFELFIGPPLAEGFSKVYGLEEPLLEQAKWKYIELYGKLECFKLYDYYPGLVEIVQRLASEGILLGVATLKNEDSAEKMISTSLYRDAFSSIHGSDDQESLSKSDIINLCIKDFGISPSRVLMVGDSPGDAHGAAESGTAFLGVEWGFGFRNSVFERKLAKTPADVYNFVLGE